jgi:nucleotide-binding universal stress UspA family protein
MVNAQPGRAGRGEAARKEEKRPRSRRYSAPWIFPRPRRGGGWPCSRPQLRAELLVIYVVPDLGRYSNFHVGNDRITDMVESILGGARQNMDECLARDFAGAAARGLVATGYAPEEILKAAEENGCDLIVMGTHGRKGIDRIIFGSVAEKVVKTSPVPVLTIRPHRISGAKETS